MESLIVVTAVLAAAGWLIYRLVAGRRTSRTGERGPGCSGCPMKEARGPGAPCAPPPPKKLVLLLLTGTLALAAPTIAWAADTVETWAPGATDVELYLGYEGLGTRREQHGVYADITLGYGIAHRLSAYLGLTLQGNGYLAEADPAVRLGVFSTILQGSLMDLDLMLEIGATGPGLSQLAVAPGTEINLDLSSPFGPIGAYLRAGLGFGGHRLGDLQYETRFALDLTPGVHWTPHEGHQLFAQYAGALQLASSEGPTRWEHAGVSVGYNVALTPHLELITQASVGPRHNEEPGVVGGVMLGFIASVPGS
ncbi:MAG: FeoB-associated Cys-rich membrane protein [Deltaproteobacteria bacterium]|nr:FeoB-associated Cys-rich membrane protein [Deltaproteobacteria bacterium]